MISMTKIIDNWTHQDCKYATQHIHVYTRLTTNKKVPEEAIKRIPSAIGFAFSYFGYHTNHISIFELRRVTYAERLPTFLVVYVYITEGSLSFSK